MILDPPDHVFLCFNMCVLTVLLERKSGITGVPFGRTEFSSCGNGTEVCALLRREGPVGPGVQGMSEQTNVFP